MHKIIQIPHKFCDYTCYVNGLEDVLAWKGGNFTDFLLSVVGGMASFAYLKFKSATPPSMVYWSTNPKYLLRNLEKIIGFRQIVSEGKSFKTTFSEIKEFIDKNDPVMAGALDMYYLHYYPQMYNKVHVPIHYFLVVGYDDEKQMVFVHDCGRKDVQQLPYAEFEKALDVKVHGMSKKNTFRVFKLSRTIPSELEVARNGLASKAQQMLKPPVKMFGIPAMRKLAKEISLWNNEECFKHLATYATTPPELPSSYEHSDGMRFAQADVLESLGKKYNINEWVATSKLFMKSGQLIKELCRTAMNQDGAKCSKLIAQIADIEEKAYCLLKDAAHFKSSTSLNHHP
ncbi:MAG: BtrH N-terminal domain-containing protein [Candidatus Bathyarchaeia archaeon]|jgi:hypothetical protein